MIVFDIDGVLADPGHREHHLHRRPKDWDAFFAAAAQDPVIEAGRVALQDASRGAPVVLVSGRPERIRTLTEDWLRSHGFAPMDLYLRADADLRPATVLKAEILQALGGPTMIGRVHDDDPQVCAALEQQGYRVQWVRYPAEAEVHVG